MASSQVTWSDAGLCHTELQDARSLSTTRFEVRQIETIALSAVRELTALALLIAFNDHHLDHWSIILVALNLVKFLL